MTGGWHEHCEPPWMMLKKTSVITAMGVLGAVAALKAFVSNLIQELKVNESKPGFLPGEREDSKVTLEREKGEPIVGFIVRGMKGSALNVATGPSE